MIAEPDPVADRVLVVRCLECDRDRRIPFSVRLDDLAEHLWRTAGWMISVVSRPGTSPVAAGPLCVACQKKVHARELLREARRRLEQNFGEPGGAS